MGIEVIAVAAGLFGLALLVLLSWRGPREKPPPRDRGVFIPGLHHFHDND